MSTALLSRESLAERSGGVRDYVSPSRLNLWLRCPLAFKLRYIDGVKTPTSPARFVGKMVHTGLENWYRHRQLGLSIERQEVLRRLTAGWGAAAAEDDVRFASVAQERTYRTQVIDLVSAYIRQVPADEVRPLAVEAAVEAPLVDPANAEDLGIPMVGVMDLVLADSGGPIITDFKTAARSSGPMEIVHEVQLSSYAYLFRHVSPQKEAGLEIRSLVKTKLPKIETHRYVARNEVHLRRLFAIVRAYLDDLDAGRFIYRPGLGCGMCDYRGSHCRSWQG